MATELAYLQDFGVEACDAKVIAVEKTDDGRTDVVLDRTCFYPRGGGQDWDTGTMTGGAKTFAVEEVRLDENGVVHHLGQKNEPFVAGATVQGTVDGARRNINTQLHSAGHLLDMAVDRLGWPWVPGRGAHYPHMSFVEYTVPENTVADDTMVATLQAKIDELHASDYQNQIHFVPVDEMGKLCRHVPPNIPTNKPSRVVLYADDFGIPCGGTHVRTVRDIPTITVTKIKIRKGLAKVSYAVAGIN